MMLALRIISVYFGKDHMILLGAFGLVHSSRDDSLSL